MQTRSERQCKIPRAYTRQLTGTLGDPPVAGPLVANDLDMLVLPIATHTTPTPSHDTPRYFRSPWLVFAAVDCPSWYNVGVSACVHLRACRLRSNSSCLCLSMLENRKPRR
jgi:hypothetical protein